MKLFLDTSVLVAAMVEGHAAHDRALPWLQRIRDGADTGVVGAHTLAELYAILTTLPVRPRLTPGAVQGLIRTNVIGVFEVVHLTGDDYCVVIDYLAMSGLTGGVTYDAVILRAAEKSQPDQILTLNENHFRRVRPDLDGRIFSP